MPAKSVRQRQFFGLVHGIQKGEVDPKDVSADIKKVAKTMKKKDVKDFASTKHTGLPDIKEILRPIIREILIEQLIAENVLIKAQEYIKNLFKRNKGKLNDKEYKQLFSVGVLKQWGEMSIKFAWNGFLKSKQILKQGKNWIWATI